MALMPLPSSALDGNNLAGRLLAQYVVSLGSCVGLPGSERDPDEELPSPGGQGGQRLQPWSLIEEGV